MEAIRIAVLGDAFVDIVAPTGSDALPLWGGDINCAAQILPHAGGSALNTATHFAGSGSTTTFFTALGLSGSFFFFFCFHRNQSRRSASPTHNGTLTHTLI